VLDGPLQPLQLNGIQILSGCPDRHERTSHLMPPYRVLDYQGKLQQNHGEDRQPPCSHEPLISIEVEPKFQAFHNTKRTNFHENMQVVCLANGG
jgi:hypothetical protein